MSSKQSRLSEGQQNLLHVQMCSNLKTPTNACDTYIYSYTVILIHITRHPWKVEEHVCLIGSKRKEITSISYIHLQNKCSKETIKHTYLHSHSFDNWTIEESKIYLMIEKIALITNDFTRMLVKVYNIVS